MQFRLGKLFKQNKGLIIFVALMAVFRSSIADWNSVPTGSMLPTIVEGDRILVNKMAYDLRIPFTHISLVRLAQPNRGDIIVFDSKQAGKRMVKRVIALPGDMVAMYNNQLTINGRKLQYSNQQDNESHVLKTEHLPGLSHDIRITSDAHPRFASFAPVQVPQGHYLVLGDNRDNSADSRVYGFVPRDEIVGRSRNVVMSLNDDNYYLPRSDRFFHRLTPDH